MAYENISVPSLRYALKSCRDSLKYSTSEEIINGLSNSNIWSCGATSELKMALEKLINERYNNIKEQINQYLSVADLIEEYQKLQKENKLLDNNYSSLNSRLYYDEYEYYTVYNEAGEEKETYRVVKVKDYNVENEMFLNRQQYNDNKTRMESLKSSISGSV